MISIEITDNFTLDEVRSLLKEGKPFNEIMQDIMKIGKQIVDRIGHKEYSSFEEFLEDIHNNKSPLQKIDDVTEGNLLGIATNVLAVKKCALGALMKEMSTSDSKFDQRVDHVMDGFKIGDGIENSFLDIGCYIMQQIRQMVVSSIKINGEYAVNYIHLGCKRDGKFKLYEDEIEAIGIDKEKVKEILNDHECVYCLSYKEAG